MAVLTMVVNYGKGVLMYIMVKFTHQLDWTTRCSDSWSNIILAVFVRVFLD